MSDKDFRAIPFSPHEPWARDTEARSKTIGNNELLSLFTSACVRRGSLRFGADEQYLQDMLEFEVKLYMEEVARRLQWAKEFRRC